MGEDNYLTFIREIVSSQHFTVKLVSSIDAEGDFFYAYILLKEEHVPYLEVALRTRDVELEEYGVVLASGKGLTPPIHVKREVEAKFQAHDSDNFRNVLEKAANAPK